MKSSFYLFSLMAVAALGIADAQSASAQEGGKSARYTYAPNVWRIEQPRMPKDYDGGHLVKQGAVPRSSNFLGLSPETLSRPAAPAPMPIAQVPARPSVSAKAFVPTTAFHPSFGSPIQPQAGVPMQVAALPPATGMPMAAPSVAHTPAPVHQASRRIPSRHTQAVTGKLVKPTHPSGAAATPATYGNMGYTPGGYLPAQSGSGMSTRADVSGRIINKTSH